MLLAKNVWIKRIKRIKRRCAIKWFKHETDSKDSEKLKDVIAEFGYEGYGWYWRIMEIVACKMDETGRCEKH